MIKDIIISNRDEYTIKLPKKYINKKLQIIITPLKEESIKSDSDISMLKGIFNKYFDLSKKQLEKEAWQKHIKEKYKKK